VVANKYNLSVIYVEIFTEIGVDDFLPDKNIFLRRRKIEKGNV